MFGYFRFHAGLFARILFRTHKHRRTINSILISSRLLALFVARYTIYLYTYNIYTIYICIYSIISHTLARIRILSLFARARSLILTLSLSLSLARSLSHVQSLTNFHRRTLLWHKTRNGRARKYLLLPDKNSIDFPFLSLPVLFSPLSYSRAYACARARAHSDLSLSLRLFHTINRSLLRSRIIIYNLFIEFFLLFFL